MIDTGGIPEESPDFIESAKRGTGVRRLNKVPLMIVGTLVLFTISAVTYTYFDRAYAAARTGSSPEEIVRVSRVAVAPVTRPAGPDVSMPTAPVVPAIVSDPGMPVAPVQESEVMRRLRDEQIAAHKSALNADPEIGKFSRVAASGSPPMRSRGGNSIPISNSLGLAPYVPDVGGIDDNQNRQDEKKDFLQGTDGTGSTYLNQVRTAPLSETELKAGSIIPGVMLSGVNSDLPGQIIGQVRQNVYDSATGRHLLIPAGAKLIGTYDSSVAAGQERVLVAWNRIVWPDGSSISLEKMPGADRSGFAGFHDQVDNHYWRTFGNAFMLSLFSAGIQLSQPQAAVGGTYNSQQIMAAALGQQLGQLGMQVARRNLGIQPTLEIRPGFQFSIMVTKDIVLPQWRGHPMAAANQ